MNHITGRDGTIWKYNFSVSYLVCRSFMFIDAQYNEWQL